MFDVTVALNSVHVMVSRLETPHEPVKKSSSHAVEPIRRGEVPGKARTHGVVTADEGATPCRSLKPVISQPTQHAHGRMVVRPVDGSCDVAPAAGFRRAPGEGISLLREERVDVLLEYIKLM